MLAGFSAVMGVQFVSLGLLAEMVNSKKNVVYPVAETLPREVADDV